MVVHDSPPISDEKRARRIADASRRLLGDEAEPRDDVHGDTVADVVREAEPTSPADVPPTAASTPGNSRTMRCGECHAEFVGESFGAVSAMVRRHRKESHAQQPKDAIPGTGGEAAPSPAPAVEEPETDGDEGSPVASRLGELLGRELGPKFKNRVRSVTAYAEKHAPSVFRSSAHLRSFLMRFGIPRDVIEICVLDQFPDEVDLLVGAAGTDYRQLAASGDPAVAALGQRVDALAQAVMGDREPVGRSDREYELGIALERSKAEVERVKQEAAFEARMGKIEAQLNAPRTGGAPDAEQLKLDRLERWAGRAEERVSKLIAPLYESMLRGQGWSSQEIANWWQSAEAESPRTSQAEIEADRRWLKPAAADGVPADGRMSPAVTLAAPTYAPPPLVLPQLPVLPAPWAIFQPRAKPQQPQPQTKGPSPAQLCDCGILKLPKESWGFVQRHSILCAWRKAVEPQTEIETTVI